MSQIPQSGQFAELPPDAPRETAQELSPALIAEQLAKAQANERTLAPFNPQATPQQSPNAAQQALDEARQMREGSASSDLNAAARALADARRANREDNVQPAASNSDSPSRGVPRPILDPGKTITGGFGPVNEAQYFPLTGEELAELVRSMLDTMNQRIANDLRFSMAITYPRVEVDLQLTFRGWVQDKSEEVVVKKVWDKTPLEVAQECADQAVFVVKVSKAEFDADGQAVDPPDRMRDELGLPKPQKQTVQAGGSRMLVDVPSLPENTF